MKKISIEILDAQHKKMTTFLEKCFSSSLEEECGLDGYTIKLIVSPFGNYLSVEMYGKVELGDVNWSVS